MCDFAHCSHRLSLLHPAEAGMADKKIAVCVLEGKVKGTIRFEQTVCLPPTVARSHPYRVILGHLRNVAVCCARRYPVDTRTAG